MPKRLKALWDHRTLSAERTADNLRVDCDVVSPLVFVELSNLAFQLVLLNAISGSCTFSRGAERLAV